MANSLKTQDIENMMFDAQNQLLNTKNFEKSTAKNLPLILSETQRKINQFMLELGTLKKEPLNIKPYKLKLGKKKQITCLEIQQLIGNSIRKMGISKKKKKNWNQQDVLILLWIIQKYNFLKRKSIEQYNETDWSNIAQLVPGKNPDECMFKWLSLPKIDFKQLPPWTQQQDKILKELVQEYEQAKKWKKISKKLYLRYPNPKIYRTDKKCRQRWQCHLNPKLKKGMWSIQEDLKLFKKTREIGKKWSIISKLLEGRTQNAVKNRFQLLYDKRKKVLGGDLTEQKFMDYQINELEMNSMISRKDQSKKHQTPIPDQNIEKELLDTNISVKNEKNENTSNIKILTSIQQNNKQSKQEIIHFQKVKAQNILEYINNIQQAKYCQQQQQLIIYQTQYDQSEQQCQEQQSQSQDSSQKS